MKTTMKYVLAALFLTTLVIAASRLSATPDPAASASQEAKPRRLDESGDDLFIAKYLAYVTNEMSPGQPLGACDACILQCERADLAGCRKSCAMACALN